MPVWSEGASCVWSATSPTLIICPKAANCLPRDPSVYFSPVCTNQTPSAVSFQLDLLRGRGRKGERKGGR